MTQRSVCHKKLNMIVMTRSRTFGIIIKKGEHLLILSYSLEIKDNRNGNKKITVKCREVISPMHYHEIYKPFLMCCTLTLKLYMYERLILPIVVFFLNDHFRYNIRKK